MRAVYRDGVPDSVNTYNTPTYSHMKDREMGITSKIDGGRRAR